MKILLTLSCMILLTTACGKEGNLADCDEGQPSVPCSERTPEEDARLALDRGDFDTAISLLSQVIEEDSENYGCYSLLAAVYAAKAGVSLTQIASTQFAGGGNFIELMTATLPDPSDVGDDATYLTMVNTMNLAVTWLKAIPAALRAETSTEDYASSARFQLTLYQAAYSVMYLNQFTVSATTGQLDPSKLEAMTEAEAITFLQNLAEAGASQEGEGGGELAAKVNEAIAEIDAQEGSGNKEKLVEFLTQTES